MLDRVPMEDRDTKGDVYEYMLGKIATAGQNGQFRTPRHIIRQRYAKPEAWTSIARESLSELSREVAGLPSELEQKNEEVKRFDLMAGFIDGKSLSANQVELINLIVNHLTEHGVVEPSRLYESPFTDLAPRGPDDLFSSGQLDELMRTLEAVRATAVAA